LLLVAIAVFETPGPSLRLSATSTKTQIEDRRLSARSMPDSSNTDESAGRCPVDHGKKSGECPVDHKGAGATSSLWKVLGIQSAAAGPDPKETSSANIPASLEEAAKHAQTPHAEQRLPLSTHRAKSSIVRGQTEKDGPHHQPSEQESKWVYPSEQQVFNAMKRKGWGGVEEESIPSFLQIHNSVNEKSWRQLCEWENDDVKLVRFQGRPNALTPKAWFLSKFLFQEKPFDRHDWFIDNGVQHEKRFVLDFYMQESKQTGLPRVEVDVRPALDSPQAFVDRAQRIASDSFPGISTALQQWQASSNRSSPPPPSPRPNADQS
jgi:cytochrome c heme-lyase